MYLRYSLSVVAPMARKLTAGKRGLEHVGGVDGALGRAGADQRVQFVDEKNDLALRVFNFLEDGFEPVFELAAIFSAGQHRAQVQGDHALVLQNFGHVTGNDSLGKALDDGSLADAGFADEHRIVLGAARKNLHDSTNFFIPSDDGIELAAAGLLSEVAGVTLQRLVLGFGILVGDFLRTANHGERFQNCIVGRASDGRGFAARRRA